MRVVTNRQRIQRNRQIAQYLFFLTLAILIGGLVLTNSTVARQNDALFFLPCLITPLGLLSLVVWARLNNQYVRPPHPEESISEGLKGINRRSALYNYLLKPNHVLVSPQGVYSLTTRFQDTRFTVQGEHWTNWKNRGPLAPFFLFFKQEGLGDPFKQARAEAEIIQKIVDQALPGAKIKVQPVVVFTGSKATLELDNPALPVVYADAKKKPSLKTLIREDKRKDAPVALTDSQIEALDTAFLKTAGAVKSQVSENEA
ncbi:MAG: nuclease-related domain-containing protein [Chloroflexota bacterium]